MPELPEVETVLRSIEDSIVSKTVTSVYRSEMPLRTSLDVKMLETVCGTKIEKLDRVGKYLLFSLSSDLVLLSHLGMSGRYLLRPKESVFLKHTHLVLFLDGAWDLHYIDPRRFGMVSIHARSPHLEHIPALKTLGPDPLSELFTWNDLQKKLQKSHQEIKQFLLDQKKLAGLGNIYAAEVLFEANIHPQTISNSLSEKEGIRLHEAVILVLTKAIELGGSTLSDGGYVDGQGRHGQYQNKLNVYDRKGLPCFRCQTTIVHWVQKQRSTYFCPQCQKE